MNALRAPYHKRIDYPAVVDRLHRGDGLRQIARDLGVSNAAVSQGARRHGWAGGRVGRKPAVRQ